jgi:hypothetical protein
MNKSSLNQESKEPIPKSKSFRYQQPLLGAISGTFSFVLIAIFTEKSLISLTLPLPGALIWEIIKLSTTKLSRSNIGRDLIVYGLSSIPLAIIGSMIFAQNKDLRLVGILLFVWYSIIAFFVGYFVIYSALSA